MHKLLKKQYVAVLTGIIFSLSCFTPCYTEKRDALVLLSGDVTHNMVDVLPKSELHFTFNHRLDHCDNTFSITGGDVKIAGWQIKGTELTVTLSQPLAYGTQYTLNLTGLSDIYFEEYSAPSITFKTKQLELTSRRFTDGLSNAIEAVNGECTRYELKLINRGEQADVWLAMVLVETDSRRMEDVIFKKITLPKGDCTISEGFTDIGENAENYTVKVFFLSSQETLIPCREDALRSVTLLGKIGE